MLRMVDPSVRTADVGDLSIEVSRGWERSLLLQSECDVTRLFSMNTVAGMDIARLSGIIWNVCLETWSG